MGVEGKRLFEIKDVKRCEIIERKNRFVVEISIGNRIYNAHITNTGRLQDFLFKGKIGFCIPSGIKTRFKLFAIEDSRLAAIIDTNLQMKAFEVALDLGLLKWLKGRYIVKRNPRVYQSILDYKLKDEIIVELKSAVMKVEDCASYPDCPSKRAIRQVGDIIKYVKNGGEALIVFIGAIPNSRCILINKKADPALYKTIIDAKRNGVMLKGVGIYFNPNDNFVYLYDSDMEVCL